MKNILRFSVLIKITIKIKAQKNLNNEEKNGAVQQGIKKQLLTFL